MATIPELMQELQSRVQQESDVQQQKQTLGNLQQAMGKLAEFVQQIRADQVKEREQAQMQAFGTQVGDFAAREGVYASTLPRPEGVAGPELPGGGFTPVPFQPTTKEQTQTVLELLKEKGRGSRAEEKLTQQGQQFAQKQQQQEAQFQQQLKLRDELGRQRNDILRLFGTPGLSVADRANLQEQASLLDQKENILKNELPRAILFMSSNNEMGTKMMLDAQARLTQLDEDIAQVQGRFQQRPNLSAPPSSVKGTPTPPTALTPAQQKQQRLEAARRRHAGGQ